ncbi:MAG: SulP family inorganic anion transporter [Pyrinomonadaceae bacterium]
MHKRLEPELFTVLRNGYSLKDFYGDLSAGITVGIVALPLSIALAIASGVKPEQGLYTAIIAGFVIAILGGSRVQISGPTGAFIVIVYGIVQQYGYQGLATATFIAGILLVIMGLARMGGLLKFVPFPVTVGFTSGIAVIIFSSQIRDFFGLPIEKVPADFIGEWIEYFKYFNSANLYSLAVGAASLFIIIFWSKITRKIPGQLVAIILMTAVVYIFQIPVDTIQSKFGAVPNSLPAPHFPAISWEMFRQMFSPAVTLALLAALESLLSAVVADGMLGTRHRSNMELVAQGAGNMASVLFAGIPATGAIARTATNIKNGAKTPIASIVHCAVLLLVLVFFGRWAALIPMTTLAAVLIVVAYNMSEWREFRSLLKTTKSDSIVLIVTFLLTVFIELTTAIQVGVLLAAFLFLQRISKQTEFNQITEALRSGDDAEARETTNLDIPEGVKVFEIYGSLFFGAVEHFNEAMRAIGDKPRVLILRMRDVNSLDASGLHSLEELLGNMNENNCRLILSAVSKKPYELMQKSGFIEKIGSKNIANDIYHALELSKQYLNET